MKSVLSLALLSSLSCFTFPAYAQFQAGDDFNHPARDTAKWGTSDGGTGDSEWVEGSNRLNFLAPFPAAGQSVVTRVWQGRSPSYTNDWQVGVDFQLNDLALFEGEGASVSIRAGDASKTDDFASMSLQLFKVDDGSVFRQLQAEAFVAGESRGSLGESFPSRSAPMRLSYDAHSRMLSLGVVGAGDQMRTIAMWNTELWAMNSESSFQIGLEALTFGAAISLGQITADNFSISEKAPRAIGVLNGGDDFNDQSRSAANWGPLDSTVGAGRLEEVAGGVRFSTLGEAGTDDDLAARLWFPGAGDFSKSWSAQIDVSLPNLGLNEGNEVELGLVVLNLADPGDRATITLNLVNDQGSIARRFYSDLHRDGSLLAELDTTAPTTAVSAALRARWDAAARQLLFDYDANGSVGGYQWTNLKAFEVATGDSNWEMSAASRFQVGVFGESYVGTFVPTTAGLVMDNFLVTSDGGVVAPVKLAPVQKVGNKLQLTWEGGKGPYQVQRRNAVSAGVWTDVGGPVNTKQAVVDIIGNLGFFRIRDLGQ